MRSIDKAAPSPVSEPSNPVASPKPPVASSFGKTAVAVKTNPLSSPGAQGQFSSSGFLFPEPSGYGDWPLKAPLAKSDYLFARSVALELSDIKRTEGLYRTQSEIDYLSSRKPSPKPATLLVPGVPVEFQQNNIDLVLLLKKDADQVLAAYKTDASTSAHADLNQLEVKRIEGVGQLESKLREINLRRFPGLPDESWGGIDKQGQAKAPTKKQPASKYYRDTITENEVILSKYGADDILAILLTEETPLLVQNGFKVPVVYHLDKKKKLEESLGLEPLPVVFYNQQTGQIISSLSAEEASEFDRELRAIAQYANRLPFDPSSLPAFFENGFNKEYLSQLQEQVSAISNAPGHSKADLLSSIDRLNSLTKKIGEGNATAETYQQFADFPYNLTCYCELNLDDQPTLAGSSSYKDRIPLIKLLAFHTFFRPHPEEAAETPCDNNPSYLNHAKNWQEYQKANLERIAVIDEIVDKAGISETVTKNFTVNSADFSLNPYMAMHWLKKHCDLDTSQSAAGYLVSAIHFIDQLPYKLSIKQRKEYFNDILVPLFKRLSEESSSEQLKLSIRQLKQKLNICLIKWIVGSKDKFPENATLNGQLIKEMDDHYPDPDESLEPQILFNDIKLLFNTMAQMVYFYEQHNPADKSWAGKELKQSIDTLKEVNKMLTEKHFDQSFFSRLHFPVNRREFINWMPNTEGSEEQRLPKSGFTAPPSKERKTPASIGNKEALAHTASLRQTLQKVIEHYYLSPHPAQLSKILEGQSIHTVGSLWRCDHGVDHIARTVILMEGVVSLHKQFSPTYQALFQRHPGLERLLSLAMAYHDVVAEIAPKSEEERLAAEALERDLGVDEPDTTTRLVISALKNKNVDTMEPIEEGYTADAQASSDERLIRRLLRLPDSIDIARVKEVVPARSFSPSRKGAMAVEGNHIYSMDWMDLDPELTENPEFMANWTALMQTSVLWASSTGAPPPNAKSLTPADIVPYSASPGLLPKDVFYSSQCQKVIARDADSIGYTRERLNDIVRLYVARQAGREVSNLFQLRQIKLPDDWTALDSFLHFTEQRRHKLEPLIHHWQENEFKHHYGTLTQTLLDSPAVQKIAQKDWHLSEVKRQRGYNESGEPKYEKAWKMTEQQ